MCFSNSTEKLSALKWLGYTLSLYTHGIHQREFLSQLCNHAYHAVLFVNLFLKKNLNNKVLGVIEWYYRVIASMSMFILCLSFSKEPPLKVHNLFLFFLSNHSNLLYPSFTNNILPKTTGSTLIHRTCLRRFQFEYWKWVYKHFSG